MGNEGYYSKAKTEKKVDRSQKMKKKLTVWLYKGQMLSVSLVIQSNPKRKRPTAVLSTAPPSHYELHVIFSRVHEVCNPGMITVAIPFLLMCVFHQCWGRVRLWLVTTAGCREEAGICGSSHVPLCPSTTKHPMNATSSGSTTYSGQLSNGFMGDFCLPLRPFYLRRGSLIALSLRLCLCGWVGVCVRLNV